MKQFMFLFQPPWNNDAYGHDLDGMPGLTLLPKYSDGDRQSASRPATQDVPGWHVPHVVMDAGIAYEFPAQGWVDYEPYAGFWQGLKAEMADHAAEFSRRSGQKIVAVLDPRRVLDGSYPVFDSRFVAEYALMDYWNDFQQTPEQVWEIHRQAEAYLGQPCIPILPMNAPEAEILRFVELAKGSPSIAWWRYGSQTESIDWWSLLSMVANIGDDTAMPVSKEVIDLIDEAIKVQVLMPLDAWQRKHETEMHGNGMPAHSHKVVGAATDIQ